MNPRLLLPTMSLLVAFEAAARHLSFTRAAAELSLTQSAVSRQVQALETLLGVQLMRREGRHIFLTDLGAVYQRELHVALNRIQNASLQVIAYRSGVGSFHLAALPTFAAKWLMPRIGEFYAEHPGTLIHVHSRIGQFDLQQAGMDAVISVGDGAWPGLVAHHLADEVLLPVISPALAGKHQVKSAADLAPLLLLQVATRAHVWRQWFVAQGLSPHAMRVGPHFEFTSHLIQAVAAGIGVGLVPSLLVQDELRSGVLQLALDIPLVTGLGYFLFVPPEKLKLAPIAAFKNWLLEINTHSMKSPPLKPLL
ncbi:DNA-binding transcriptional LysR family regulator [Variovorax paradoxus]|uniref:DNA-binding transcriptional LysR family regulator n=1 Tax=Variovorax paradoxus TaxID=34073 RepID=A0AAW8E7U2_VARPD|nr:LysR substrate-binding domain-containing protein [Variovorax paradoxus]MDP9968915.1 DNA-binding transcriptional LysR family regulator [Variovorax paradoxus]